MNFGYSLYPLIPDIVYCFIIVYLNKYIAFYNIIISYPVWIGVDLFFLLGSYYVYGNLWIYCILTLYLVNTFLISKIRNNSQYFILGILIALFQSEYWEIPLHLYYNIFNIGTVFVFICLIYTLYILGFNCVDFIKNLLIISIPYFIFCYIFYPLPIIRNNFFMTDFVFRIFCSILFVGVICRSDKLYIANDEKLGGTHESS